MTISDERLEEIRAQLALDGDWNKYEGDLPVTDACAELLAEVDRLRAEAGHARAEQHDEHGTSIRVLGDHRPRSEPSRAATEFLRELRLILATETSPTTGQPAVLESGPAGAEKLNVRTWDGTWLRLSVREVGDPRDP